MIILSNGLQAIEVIGQKMVKNVDTILMTQHQFVLNFLKKQVFPTIQKNEISK